MSQEWTQPVAAIASINGDKPSNAYLWPTWQRIAYSEYPTRHLDYYWRLDLTQLNTGLYVLDGFMGPATDIRYYLDFRSALRAQAAWLIRQARLRLKGADQAAVIRWTMENVMAEGHGGSAFRLNCYFTREENEIRLAVIEREKRENRLRECRTLYRHQPSLFSWLL